MAFSVSVRLHDFFEFEEVAVREVVRLATGLEVRPNAAQKSVAQALPSAMWHRRRQIHPHRLALHLVTYRHLAIGIVALHRAVVKECGH